MAHFKDNKSNYINTTYDNVIKSLGDKRDYKAFILNNGLKILLISDPETDKSAVALDVNIGSMSDPRELQGLAHFLEHMLFMGTKKYPEENDYRKYISQNGGHCNAYTSGSHTNYYFDISPKFLSGALDRFAQFFLNPLFTESATDREVNAVNSEHEKNLDQDARRVFQLEKALTDPNHDYSKFGTGNMKTLSEIPKQKGINVREALLHFHSKWYSANIMSLVVLGKESLEELMDTVIPLFSEITNNSAVVPIWETHPFTSSYLRKEILIVPIMDYRSLRISFPIPDLVAYYKSQPGGYIAHLIDHEGPGSLLSELKSRGWSTKLYAYDSRGAKGFGFFQIIVDLTEEGIEHIYDIITIMFQYINMLKRVGPKQWIFDENKKIKEINFQFKCKETPINYVKSLASILNLYSLNESLIAGNLLEEYKPDLITDILDLLTPDKVRISVIGKKFKEITDSKEEWYGTQYKMSDIPEETLNQWKNCGFNENLRLPPINDFIPSNFNLTNREEIKANIPSMIRNTKFSRVWYLQDNQYLKPKVYYRFQLTNSLAYVDPFHQNATYLFARLFNDSMSEYSYAADLAGIYYIFYNNTRGLRLKLGGYNDKLHILLSKILNEMVNFKVDPKRFEIIKEIYIRGLKNYPTQPLHDLLEYYTTTITSEKYWSYDELIETLNDITVENLTLFIPQLLSQLHIEALIHGNVEKNEALKICDLVENELRNHLNTRPIALSQHFRNREIQLIDGSNYSFETTNDIHQTKAIQIYFQIGVQETISNACLELLEQVINENFFNILRTKEQLGYLTWSFVRRAHGVQGLSFIIESDYMPSYLNERIEAFISWVEHYIRDMSEDEFEIEKQALITKRLEMPKQLFGFSINLWFEIMSQQYNFNRDEIEAQAIQKLTKENLISFFKTHLSSDSPKRKKLSVSILSLKSEDKIDKNKVKEGLFPATTQKGSKRIEEINHFKEILGFYPLPEPYIDVYKIDKQNL